MIGESLTGGLLGTLVLTTILRVASELGLTRMDLALILGTAFTQQRRRARAVGYLLTVLLGIVFAIGYQAVFSAVGWSSWWLGAGLGALHAVFLASVIINVLLPVIHPLMGTPETGANEIALIEPPGFLMLNYGRSTFLVTLAAHILYGAIVGWAAK